ncbi:MAG: hypothetical protein WDN75_14780 [Bacteroidota bacterium]
MSIPDLPIPAVNCVLTFRPYLRYVEEQIAITKSDVYRKFLESIVALLKASPELLEPIQDMSLLDKHEELIELIKTTQLSQINSDHKLYTLGIPSGRPPKINYFGYSDEFAEFFKERIGKLRLYSPEVGEEFRRANYREILKRAYNIASNDGAPEAMMQWVYEVNGVRHFYKVIRHHQFVNVGFDGDLPPLQQEWVDYASGTILNHNELTSPLPFSRLKIEGFFVFSLEDETKAVALAELNKIVTQLHLDEKNSTTQKLRQSTLSLMGSNKIEMGFLGILKVNGNYVYHDIFSSTSIVFGRLKAYFTTEELTNVYHFIAEQSSNTPSILSSMYNDVHEMCDSAGNSGHVRQVLDKQGIHALKFIPVWHNNILLGIIELGSQDENEINVEVLRSLDAAIPVFREYFLHKTNSFHDYMKSFIMQRYTSIQKSVAWKFNEEVWNTLKNVSDHNLVIETPPVRFENLYPFYGAVDFRNSSQKQMEAIHSDYETQLNYLQALLERDDLAKNDPYANDFLVKVQYWRDQLSSDIDIQEEAELRNFLESESVNSINLLAAQKKIQRSEAVDYTWTVTSKYGKFHVFHNKYEESIQELNRVLKEELLKAEVALQEKLPHYFEKFQTDGIEYSLYAGNSINPSQAFSPDSVRIIVDWQLDVMLKMANATNRYKENLSVPLETTQLILVHENTVDISYRIDERHFDVEGSYSIRYQVLKKRIDKVRLLNSPERLTPARNHCHRLFKQKQHKFLSRRNK